MPFTFSHPAIVLPLSLMPKRWVSLTGLILGSIMPDFEKFFKMAPYNTFSHTWHAIFWFNLPLALFLCFVFHLIVRDTLIRNLPVFLKSRFCRYIGFNWNKHFLKYFVVVIASILIGATSHLFWDSFTHKRGFFVRRFNLLTNKVYFINDHAPIYLIIDRLSSLLGVLLILIIIIKLPKQKIETDYNYSRYWILTFTIILVVLGLRFLTGLDFYNYFEILLSSLSAILISLIVSPSLLKVINS